MHPSSLDHETGPHPERADRINHRAVAELAEVGEKRVKVVVSLLERMGLVERKGNRLTTLRTFRGVRELQAFNRRYTNPISPLIWKVYGHYLRANRQPQGIRTYSEVLAWLIAYENKYGWNFD